MKRLPTLTALGFGAAAAITAILAWPDRVVTASFDHGRNVSMAPVGTLSCLHDSATCKITYQPGRGPAGEIALWQGFFDQPVIMMPSSDSNALLCLYDHDVRVCLLKIDAAKAFEPFPKNSVLNYIVSSSPWAVSLGSTNDWAEAIEYLRTVPASTFRRQSVPTLSLGALRLHAGRDAWLDRLERTTIVPPS